MITHDYKGAYDGHAHGASVTTSAGTVYYSTVEPYVLDSKLIMSISKVRLGESDSLGETNMPTLTNVGSLTVYYLVVPGNLMDAILGRNKARLGKIAESECCVVVGSVTIDIARCPMSACDVTLSPTSYVYDGAAKRPVVAVWHSGRALRNGDEYTLSYTNNTNVGTSSITSLK